MVPSCSGSTNEASYVARNWYDVESSTCSCGATGCTAEPYEGDDGYYYSYAIPENNPPIILAPIIHGYDHWYNEPKPKQISRPVLFNRRILFSRSGYLPWRTRARMKNK